MKELQLKARKVFKGLDDRDFQILGFFYLSEKPASKYDAMKTLPQIPRATLYRKVGRLRDKGFLRVVQTKPFEAIPKKGPVELLDVKVVKGLLAGLGCMHTQVSAEVFGRLPETGSRLFQVLDPQFQYEFYDKLFDVLIEMNEDLTDKEVDLYLLFYQLALKKPEVAIDFVQKAQLLGLDTRARFVKEIMKVLSFMKEEFGKDV
jgi:hypothetical protein